MKQQSSKYSTRRWVAQLLAGTLVTVVSALAQSASTSWNPTQNVELVSPAGPAGAIDNTARLIQELLRQAKLVETSISVVNKPGGGHSIGYAYLNQHTGDGHYLLVTSIQLITNRIVGTSKIHHSDLTPIALLFTEYVAFTVNSDSPIKTPKELAQQLRDRPEILSISVGSAAVGANYVAVANLTKVLGGEPKKLKILTFKSSAEAATALMGGHIDLAASSISAGLAGISSGKNRVVAVAAPRRLTGRWADIPTWKEYGVDVSVGNWRILIGPGKMSPQQIQFWDKAMEKLVTTPRWTQSLEEAAAVNDYLSSRETKRFLEEQEALYKSALANLRGGN